MEYNLRRYEAIQRLLWFLFFLACLAVAYPAAKLYQSAHSDAVNLVQGVSVEVLRSTGFWTSTDWIRVGPLGNVMVYLIWVALFFLLGRVVWLGVQFVGKHMVKNLLSETIPNAAGRAKPSLEHLPVSWERIFPVGLLLQRMDSIVLQAVFHPFQRLRLMLNNPQGILSSEELAEKERRVAEADWDILWSSWSPFRWLVWLLPVLAIGQACWLIYLHVEPAVSGQKDLQEIISSALASFLPLAQVIAIAIFFNLASGLVRRVESLYLSNVDALLYDKFLSRLPFHSSDTLILLEALQRHFKEIHNVLRRLEAPGTYETNTSGLKN